MVAEPCKPTEDCYVLLQCGNESQNISSRPVPPVGMCREEGPLLANLTHSLSSHPHLTPTPPKAGNSLVLKTHYNS